MRMRAMLERRMENSLFQTIESLLRIRPEESNGPGGPSSIFFRGWQLYHIAHCEGFALPGNSKLQKPSTADLHRHIRRCIRIDVLLRKRSSGNLDEIKQTF